MSGEMNEILHLLNKISLTDTPKELLTDLKITLTGLPVNRLQNVPGINDFNILFDNINSSDSEQVDLCVDILNQLLPLLDAKLVVEQLGDHLARSFGHPNENVRSLALQQVKLCAQVEGGVHTLLTIKPLLLGTVRCVADDSLAVVKTATSTIITIASSSVGTAAIFSNESVTILEHLMAKSDSCRFNIYEAIIKVSLLHDEALAIVSNSGLLDRLIAEVTAGDILTQLNALQMVTTLAVNPAGLALLQQGGVISKFQYLLSLTESDPLAAMLLPGLLKFFGSLGYVQPLHLAENYTSALISIFRLAGGKTESSDPVLVMVAFETITHIGYTREGKYTLGKFKGEMEQVLNHFGSKMQSVITDHKARIIEAITPLFELPIEQHSDDFYVVTQEWWTYFCGSSAQSIEKLVAQIKQPFPNLHQAALYLLTVIATLPWGQRLIATEPGFVEYLLDRRTESDKRGKELKWEVLRVLMESNFGMQIFGDEILERITKYYKQGPFFVEADPQLAFEGDT